MSKNLVATVVRQATLADHLGLYIRLRQASFDPKRSKAARLAARLAARWLRARTFQAIEDAMARLQVLEGVAEVRSGTWSNKGLRGLGLAQAALADSGSSIDPSWFSPKPTGMLKILFTGLSRLVKNEAEDVLQNGLMGIGTEGDEYTKGPLLYQVGRYNLKVKQGILDGSETPERVAAGAGGHVFRQKALNLIRTERTRQEITGPTINNPGTVDDEGLHRDVADVPKRDLDRMVIDIMTDPMDPLGRRLLDRIQASWSRATGNTRTILDWWVEDIRQGRSPVQQEYANRLGINIGMVQAAIRRYVHPAIEELKNDDTVQRDIEQRLMQQGRLASRWLARRQRRG